MRALIGTIFLIGLLLIPAQVKAGPLPDLQDSVQEAYVLYGGSEGQELWLAISQDLEKRDAGFILESIEEVIPGLTATAIYGWYRIRGDVSGELPEEAHDYVYGVQYNTDGIGPLTPFLATEQVKWTSGPEIDIGYFGIGCDWIVNRQLTLRGCAWNDMADNYRVTANARIKPHSLLELNVMTWLMIDRGDEWGLWRVRASHPVGDNIDAVAVYEDSTRSDSIFTLGFSYMIE